MQMLKQSTAATILVGPVLDSAGAAVTTAVIGDFQATKNGTSAALASPATATHSHNGFYLLALTTGNTDTVGRLVISVNNTAQSMSTHRYTVLLPSVFDALITNATNTSGGLPAATGAITALAGAVSTYAGGDTAGTTTLLTRLPSAISLSSGAVTVGTNNDKSGYSLTPATGLGNQTANITGNLSGSVGSVTGAVGSVTAGVTVTSNNDKTGYSLTQAFPSNFASLGINANGHVSRVTLVDTCTVNSDMRGTDNAALASAWTATRAGYLDSVLLAANANRTVQVTGSNHVAADIHELQPAVITSAAFATGWLTAAGTAADYVTELQTAIGTATNQTAILDRLGAFTGSGVNTVLGFLKAIASKAASTPTDIGGTFSATTDSIEAIRDAMQAGTGDASQATLVQVQGTVDAIAASLSGTAINVVSRVADGGSITLYAGDDMRVRSGTEVAVTISDVGGAIYTRLNAIGVAQLAFGAARPSQPAGAITGTIASLTQAGSGSSQTLTINIEIEDSGERLAPADNYVWQIVSSDAQGSEYDTYTEVEGTLTLKRRVAVPLYS